VVLAEIDELGDKLSPARAEALLDEFEREIGGALLRQDMAAVMAIAKNMRGASERSPKKKIEGDSGDVRLLWSSRRGRGV
jgi:hypothetical protein